MSAYHSKYNTKTPRNFQPKSNVIWLGVGGLKDNSGIHVSSRWGKFWGLFQVVQKGDGGLDQGGGSVVDAK